MSEAALGALSRCLRALFVAGGMSPAFPVWADSAPARAIEQRDFPVRRWLKTAVAQAPTSTERVAAALEAAEHQVQWGQTYAHGDFLDGYAWAELIGSKGPIKSETHAVGFLLLAPHTFYPPHSHPAREFYVPISGLVSWFSDDEAWRFVPPGALIHHAPNVAHAITTGAQPLLAAYCWIGDDVQTSASIVDR